MPFPLVGGEWPSEWAPHDFGTVEQESFDNWWLRVAGDLGHLDSRVAEQWVYRHWELSPYYGVDLARLCSSVAQLSTSTILDEVRSDCCEEDKIEPVQAVWELFNPKAGPAFEPARTMNRTGTWNIPIVVVRSDDGFSRGDDSFFAAKLWLIEGHQRLRYLRVLAVRRFARSVHEVIVLTLRHTDADC
jgi:hypothetical protein